MVITPYFTTVNCPILALALFLSSRVVAGRIQLLSLIMVPQYDFFISIASVTCLERGSLNDLIVENLNFGGAELCASA